MVGICDKILFLSRLSEQAQCTRDEVSHLIVMFKLDTLVDIPACLEQAKTVRSQDLEHWIAMAEIISVSSEVCVVDRLRGRHNNTLKVEAGKEGLGQRVA